VRDVVAVLAQVLVAVGEGVHTVPVALASRVLTHVVAVVSALKEIAAAGGEISECAV
jgi:hypothetical protein